MTIVATQSILTPKDYPEFDQTVGNSFASSYPDAVQKDEADLTRLANVSQGLFKIYETVIDDAAKGSPMTPRDSAVIATTVANMTSSVGVESSVQPMVSLESRYDQHMGYIITQESLSETIKKTVAAFVNGFLRLLSRLIEWIRSWINAATDNSRPMLRALNTLRRLGSIDASSVKYTPSMSGILVDTQIPADWFTRSLETLTIISRLTAEQQKMAQYGVDIMDKVAAVNPTGDNATSSLSAIKSIVARAPRVSLGSYKDRSEKYGDKEIEWSGPLCGNTVAIAMNPLGDEPIDAVNYGAALVHTSVAAEFGVKTKFADSAEGGTSDSIVTINVMDYVRSYSRLESILKSHNSQLTLLDDTVGRLETIMKKVSEKFRSNSVSDDGENETMQDLLTFSGVARSTVSAALASARYSHEAYSNTTGAISAIFAAINSKAGVR